MAAIGKIREQSTLLLIIIGGAMVAFVLGDFFSNRGSSPQDQYVGEVFGQEINLVDYEQRVQEQIQAMASIGQGTSSAQDQQIRNQVWNDMIQEKIMYSEMNKLGMRLSQDEFDDIRFGQNIRPDFMNNQNFTDPQTGQFDPKLVQNYFAFIQQNYPLYYENQVNRIVNDRLYEKYNNMVKYGEYVNTLEAKDEYYRQKQSVNFSFVVKNFASVPDSTVEVSESDLRAYYDKHKDEDRFDKPAEVSLSYVVFDVEPTDADEAAVKEDIATLIPDFENAKNDSVFVMKYSASRNPATIELDAQGDADLQTMIDNASPGDVIGPYKSGDRYAIAKILSKGTKEEATARHILLSNQSNPDKDALMARADSIKKAIQKGTPFEDMVTKYSDDPGSIQNGGKYEWFDRKTMVEPFTEASFDKPIGTLNIVETNYGIHIVEPLERREVNVVEAKVVDELIEPSSDTFNNVYEKANTFSINAENAKGFAAKAEESGLKVEEAKNLNPQVRNLPSLPNSAEAIRWAHNADKTEVGDVSQPFEFGSNIVVAALTKRTKAGVQSFEDAKDEIRPDVIREKKVEMFKKEMANKSPEELASELGETVQRVTNATEKRPSLPGAGAEPYIVGYALTMQEGDVSAPLEGSRGVYVIKLNKKSDVEALDNYDAYRQELLTNEQNNVKTYQIGVYKALRDMANVKDERGMVF